MTVTDELRRMLDECGVKWEARTSPRGRIWTYWDTFNGHRVYAMDNENGTVEIFGEWDVTPAQAIAATVGRGTCKVMRVNGFMEYIECSECGYRLFDSGWIDISEWNFCPKCGRRVVDK